jgi:hypothetical protein
VAIGAPYNDAWNNSISDKPGHFRIYEWDSTGWSQIGSEIDGKTAIDLLGWSISMNAAGDRVTSAASGIGEVRVYTNGQLTVLAGSTIINNIKVYPIPFSTSTTIELPSEPHILTIYDIVGNKVREEQVNGTTIIERRDLNKGIYIIEVKSENNTHEGKLVVE